MDYLALFLIRVIMMLVGVIGIDLGTSSVKVILVNQKGQLIDEYSVSYPLIQRKSGFVEQDPEIWFSSTMHALQTIIAANPNVKIEGISFSGQMHGLVIIDEQLNPLRHAILWNDTRTTEQCRLIVHHLGESLYDYTKNDALEGFTLPKLLWVQQHEPTIFKKIAYFMLPKDYVRFKLTGEIATEPSDAAGTLLYDLASQNWSREICETFQIPITICPNIIHTTEKTGYLKDEIKNQLQIDKDIPIFAGAADNACGALGAGIIHEHQVLVSIGTSGVVLKPSKQTNYEGNFIHTMPYVEQRQFYKMGVTLAAGESLRWFTQTFAPTESISQLLQDLEQVDPRANRLLFTPYIFGERTPHGSSTIRGSFIGINSTHRLPDFTRAVIEGVTFSLKEVYDLLVDRNESIQEIICIGGAAKSDSWLEIVANIFNMPVKKLQHEQGPALGAAIIAAFGAGWFDNIQQAVQAFVQTGKTVKPTEEIAQTYAQLFQVYKQIYAQTISLNEALRKM